ncbi:SDH family Clp fold serine proteinase [Pseudomonas qingdaonensis]|uniref:SDH family Clp fold serine proteinase n=1 Tax=Pseudomonas qingdaonensis TaxID=2056231 RepID=UPI00368834B4
MAKPPKKNSTAPKEQAPPEHHQRPQKLTIQETLGLIEKSNDADVFMYAGPIERQFELGMLITIQHKQNKKPNAILFLDTYGGHADAAYKIAKAFKRNYKQLTVMVFSDCKSAGTLLCLGADHLVMADLAELGPLDVQIPKEGEFSGRRSGLDITDTLGALQIESIRLMRQHFLDLRVGSRTQISTRDALENATRIVCGLLAPVYSQINPLSLGESARSNSIAYHYGQRLSNGNLHPGTLNKLISGYPSHGFVIDREEAAELFISVRAPTPNEEMLMLLLLQQHEQLASRQKPLISCLTDDYPSPKPDQEPPKNGSINLPNQQTPSAEPGSTGGDARNGHSNDHPGDGRSNGGGNGKAKPNARNPGAKGPNTTSSRASRSPAKPPVKPDEAHE